MAVWRARAGGSSTAATASDSDICRSRVRGDQPSGRCIAARAPRSPGCGYANETLLGSSPDGNHATALAMVLPKTLCGLSGLDGSIDPDGGRGFAVVLAVLTHDNPSRIGPLHDLGMVDLPHQLRVSCSPTALPSSTLAMFRYRLPHGPRGPGRTRRSRELDPNVASAPEYVSSSSEPGQLWTDEAALRLRAFPFVEEVGPSEVQHLVLQCELRPPDFDQPSGRNQRRVRGQNPLGRGRRTKIVDHVDPHVGVETQRTNFGLRVLDIGFGSGRRALSDRQDRLQRHRPRSGYLGAVRYGGTRHTIGTR